MHAWLLAAMALATGALVPVQIALNAALGRSIGSPLATTTLVFLLGVAISAGGLLVTRTGMPSLATIAAAPPWTYLGSLLAVIYLLAVVYLAPRLGVGLTTMLILVGQLVAAMLIDHFALFGALQHAFNGARALGLALMIGGVLLIKLY